jgi:8-oxo-dGTP pyrophosphatase MutT (NUDIX family)
MRSRALIIDKEKVLLLHRFKNGKEYFVLPGGHIEENETEEEALIREIKEETNLDIQVDKKLWSLFNQFDDTKYHVFLVTKFSGNLKLGGPELKKGSKDNVFLLEWHDLKNVEKLNFVPKILKTKIITRQIKNYLNTKYLL